MRAVLHAPPGRAGRLWLQRRIVTAEHGADLLDHKLRILRGERERMALRSERTAAAWEAASLEASTWLLRATLAGGERSVRLSSEQTLADVEVVWEQPMGVRYPAEARCVPPPASADPPQSIGAAVVTARECHRRALQAGAEHAAVEAAVRILEAEEGATRRRLRAIENRWIPRLREALAEVQLALEEEEHADGVRLRWAVARQPRSAGRAPDPASARGDVS